MKIEVTVDDIAKGKKGSLVNCPIGLAIKRLVGMKELRVNSTVIILEIDLPSEAKLFIKNFDAGNNVEPFEFEVNLENSSTL